METIEPNHLSFNTFYLTPEGHQALQQELEYLIGSKRSEIADRMRDSQQHGEYSEDNSELDSAKFEQTIVENRIAELKLVLANAHILKQEEIPVDHVGVGSYVTVKDAQKGFEFTLRIVSSAEANPEQDLISNEAPLGQALFGRSKGEIADFDAPAGHLKYEILEIKR